MRSTIFFVMHEDRVLTPFSESSIGLLTHSSLWSQRRSAGQKIAPNCPPSSTKSVDFHRWITSAFVAQIFPLIPGFCNKQYILSALQNQPVTCFDKLWARWNPWYLNPESWLALPHKKVLTRKVPLSENPKTLNIPLPNHSIQSRVLYL